MTADDIFEMGAAMMRAQAAAIEQGDRHGRHARALEKALAAMEDAAKTMEFAATSYICEPPQKWWSTAAARLRRVIAEAREMVDG